MPAKDARLSPSALSVPSRAFLTPPGRPTVLSHLTNYLGSAPSPAQHAMQDSRAYYNCKRTPATRAPSGLPLTCSVPASAGDEGHQEPRVDFVHAGGLLRGRLRAALLLVRCVVIVHHKFLDLHKALDDGDDPKVRLRGLETRGTAQGPLTSHPEPTHTAEPPTLQPHHCSLGRNEGGQLFLFFLGTIPKEREGSVGPRLPGYKFKPPKHQPRRTHSHLPQHPCLRNTNHDHLIWLVSKFKDSLM